MSARSEAVSTLQRGSTMARRCASSTHGNNRKGVKERCPPPKCSAQNPHAETRVAARSCSGRFAPYERARARAPRAPATRCRAIQSFMAAGVGSHARSRKSGASAGDCGSEKSTTPPQW
ncbi:MAG: hypothetical protein R3A52_07380 [Polyangiales bacterium]